MSENPATFFSPAGDVTKDAKAIAARYRKDARGFAAGGKNELQILQMQASGSVAWWSGYQVAKAKLKGKAGLVPMKLRVTEGFRLDEDGWKLAHRHAEMVKQ